MHSSLYLFYSKFPVLQEDLNFRFIFIYAVRAYSPEKQSIGIKGKLAAILHQSQPYLFRRLSFY